MAQNITGKNTDKLEKLKFDKLDQPHIHTYMQTVYYKKTWNGENLMMNIEFYH